MNELLLKLIKVVTSHYNFSLNPTELKLYYNRGNCSSYNEIKDIVSITEDLNKLGIEFDVHDKYIQARKATAIPFI